MIHIETMKELIEWAWQRYCSLMRKHKYLSREDITMTAHIGLQAKLMQHFYTESQTAIYHDQKTDKLIIFGLSVIFSDDYDTYTCSVGVPSWKPGVNIMGQLNEKPETFTVNIHALIK